MATTTTKVLLQNIFQSILECIHAVQSKHEKGADGSWGKKKQTVNQQMQQAKKTSVCSK